MVPPVAVDGSLVSIRKFKKDKLGIDDLVRFGAFTEEMAAYLLAGTQVVAAALLFPLLLRDRRSAAQVVASAWP